MCAWRNHAADHQRSAAIPKIAGCLSRVSSLALGSESQCSDHLCQLRSGSGQQACNGLPRCHFQRLLSVYFPDAPFLTTSGSAGIRDHTEGVRLATSVGGVLTGRGADSIIIDDPLKPDEALSETQRNAANAWYDHTRYSRLNDKNTGCIILIM